MDNTAINLDEQIEVKALAIPQQARMITVTDDLSLEQANEFNLSIRQSIKDIEDWFSPLVKKAHDAHKSLTLKRAETLKPLEEASAYITGQVKTYIRKLKEEEERQAAILREQARKEEEDRRLAMAAELESVGNVEEANALLDEEPVFIAPVPVVDIPKVDQRIYRTVTKMKVVDRMAFLKVATPELLLEILNEAAWASIESGLTRKAKMLGRRFCPAGCQQIEV